MAIDYRLTYRTYIGFFPRLDQAICAMSEHMRQNHSPIYLAAVDFCDDIKVSKISKIGNEWRIYGASLSELKNLERSPK
ncbi:MAG: hypothetical protein IJ575_09910 [Selenomonadaceae bacterium]|nr:hypothetical protein [Selenomonadaceae bacterium]